MLKQAALVLLLAFGGQGSPPETNDTFPLVLAAPAPRLTSAVLRGTWLGTRVPDDTTTRSPVEVVFAESPRPATVFGYFTLSENGGASRFRRLGSMAADRVTFEFADGQRIILRLDEDGRRLLGRLAGHGPASSIDLARLRPHAEAAPPLSSRGHAIGEVLTRPGTR